MGTIMVRFLATGVSRSKIEKFLDADWHGTGSARDQIAADMTNQLMAALGQRQRQSPHDVKRIRERGRWIHLDRRPPE